MNDFFLDCLKQLKILRGVNQYEDLLAKGEKGKQDTKQLLIALVATCNQFNYIPDEVKQRVIKQRILDDTEFYNLNASKVWHWLNQIAGKYYNHGNEQIQPENNATEMSDKTRRMLSEFMVKLLASDGMKMVPSASNEELEAIIRQDNDRTKRKSYSLDYIPDKNLINTLELKHQYAVECTDLIMGKPKPGAPTFDEWVKNKKK